MAGERRRTARRLLALWAMYGAMDLRWVLRDARALILFAFSDLIASVASVAGTFLLAGRFHGIGRWTAHQLLFMLGYALLVSGLPSILFNYNIGFISRRIGRGQLDHTLVQPQPLWMALLTEGFSPFSAALDVLPGVALFLWALRGAGIAITVPWLAELAVNIAGSTAIVLAFTYTIGSLAFWAPRAAEEINSETWGLLGGLRQYPLDAAGSGLQVALLGAIPVGFVAWYPSRALLGLQSARYGWAVTPLAACAFVALAVWVFRKGLVQYGRTGSQRYLSFGHRR